VTPSKRLTVFFTLLPFFFLRASAQTPGPTRKSSEDGLQLLHKMQTALGGADKIAAIHDYEETVRAETWFDTGAAWGEARKRTRWMRSPNLLRLDQRGPRDTYVLYFDGDSGSGWEMLPDRTNPDKFKTMGEAIDLVGDELRFAKSYLSDFQFNVWLADRISGFVVTSPAPNVLRIEHDGSATDFMLDGASSVPVKTVDVPSPKAEHKVSSEMHYEEWTQVAGISFPTHRTLYHNTVKVADMTSEEPLRVNVGLRLEELAAKPADFAPEMPGP
jgi:hypothetical protein